MDDITFDPDIEEPLLPMAKSSALPIEALAGGGTGPRPDNVAEETDFMDPRLLEHQQSRRELSERLERDSTFRKAYIQEQEAKRLEARADQLVSQIRRETAVSKDDSPQDDAESEGTVSEDHAVRRPAPRAAKPAPRDVGDALESLPEPPDDAPPATVIHIAHVEHLVLHLHFDSARPSRR